MSDVRYRFKYSNYDLARYVESRRAVAVLNRREAQLLMTQADTIDEEMRELERHLLPESEDAE